MTLSLKNTRRLVDFSLFGIALWFFGNLYEEIVLMPNWLVAPLHVLQAYNQYYTVIIQYHYYVPITQIAIIVLIALSLFDNPARQSSRRNLHLGAIWGLAGILLTVWIVLSLNLDLFIGQLRLTEAEAHRKGITWMIRNGIRLFCVGMSLGATLRLRDQLRE